MFTSIVNFIFGKKQECENKPEEKSPRILPKYESTEEIAKKKILKILPKDNWHFSKDFFVADDKVKEKRLSALPISISDGNFQKKTTIHIILRQFIEDKLAKKSQAYRSNSNGSKEAEFLRLEEAKIIHKVEMNKFIGLLADKRNPYRCHSGFLPKDIVRDVPTGIYFNKKAVRNRKRNMSDLGNMV
jgi:hypothetical protein